MKWLKKLWDRLSRKDYVRVRNKKLRSTIHMLTDYVSEEQQELIATEEASVLMTSHIREEIDRKMDYIGILEQGRLVQFHETGEKEYADRA